MEHSHEKQYSPDEEFEIARWVYENERDLKHAAHHLSAALAGNPLDPARIKLLDTLIAESADPLALAPTSADEATYFGTVAVRAYVLAKIGRVVPAVELVAQILGAGWPGYLPWAFDWLAANPSAAADVNRDIVCRALAGVMQRYSGSMESAPGAQAVLNDALRFAEHFDTGTPPDESLRYIRIVLLRKVGRPADSRALGEASYRESPGYRYANGAAYAAREAGDADGCLAWQLRALEHEPSDVATRLDIADGFLDRRRFPDAVTWYAAAAQLEPGHPWATPSLMYSRYRNGEGEHWLDRLEEFAERNEDNDRAVSLVSQTRPYLGYLPGPAEASANVLADMVAKKRNGQEVSGIVSQFVTSLEPPSMRLAFRRQMLGFGATGDSTVSYGQIQSPDPRLPRKPVDFLAWRYREAASGGLTTDADPVLVQPPTSVTDAVAWLAGHGFYRPGWYDAAEKAVGSLPHPIRAEHLVAAMTHPPVAPNDWPEPDWVFRCQVATALMIAHLDPELPWANSERRKVLLDLARGPMDWTVSAAVVALAEVAGRDADAISDVHAEFRDLLGHQPLPGHICYLDPVIACGLRLPELPPDLREELIRVRSEYEDDDPESK